MVTSYGSPSTAGWRPMRSPWAFCHSPLGSAAILAGKDGREASCWSAQLAGTKKPMKIKALTRTLRPNLHMAPPPVQRQGGTDRPCSDSTGSREGLWTLYAKFMPVERPWCSCWSGGSCVGTEHSTMIGASNQQENLYPIGGL